MFRQPRQKKGLLPTPPSKKRKTTHAIEEISFDNTARSEYLTGFHKRKQQRIKHAQEQAAEKDKLERRELKKQMREERQRQVEEHVQSVNEMLRRSEAAGAIVQDTESDTSEWEGFQDPPVPEFVDHEDEYIDEDRYTTVTVESVTIGRDGFHKPQLSDDEAEESKPPEQVTEDGKSKKRAPKKPKKKFRYETKIERQLTDRKQKAKKMAKVAKVKGER